MYLEQIHEANDIKKLNERELAGLAEEIRTFLVEKISKTGGHLASNLGGRAYHGNASQFSASGG